jgi:hypothetical protein
MGNERLPNPHAEPNGLSELTSAYHDARHLLAFLSGLLLTWDYLGLRFEGAPEGVLGLKAFIKYPDAIPNAILILACYAALRVGIEWWQCDETRRDTTASIVDCGFSYFLFVAAVTGYILRRFQADFSRLTIIGVAIGVLIAPLFVLLLRLPQANDKWVEGITRPTTRLLWTMLSGSGVAALTGTAIGLALDLQPSVILGVPIGAALAGIAGAFFSKRIGGRLRGRLPAA